MKKPALLRRICQRTCAAALILLTLAACSDGYPTGDGDLILRTGMSLDNAMAALHKLGHAQPSDYHWHYAFLPGCTLQIHARRFLGSKEPRQVSLRQSVVLKTTDDNGAYIVSLVPRGSAGPGTVVMDRMDAVDATQVEWLIRYLPAFCEAGSGHRNMRTAPEPA